jgi:hypothetical protein
MSAAAIAGRLLHAYCTVTWPNDENPKRMASTIANGSYIDVFDHQGGGSHKYIPADRLTDDLGEPRGAGVYGYWKMFDGSYLLRTCDGRLAHWDGTDEGKAEWCE